MLGKLSIAVAAILIPTTLSAQGVVPCSKRCPSLSAFGSRRKRRNAIVDHLHYLLELHENNAIVLYTPTLSQQIPESFAANAFNVFQQGMHQFEIVRLCALWDRAEPEKENIPTIIKLIDHPDVIEALAQETASHWQSIGCEVLNPSPDPELRALEAQAFQRSNQQFGH